MAAVRGAALGLAALAVAAGASAQPAPEAPGETAPGTPETLILTAPAPGAGGPRCAARSEAWEGAMRPVALERSFLDDFDRFELSDGPWTPHFDHGPYEDWRARTLVPNGESQIYVDPGYAGSGDQPLGLNPFEARDGVLRITADRTPEALAPLLENHPYISGLITSRHSHLQQHGYFEIRARMPAGRGLWPAFWLHRVGQWPPEIDVLEVLAADPEQVHMTVHWHEAGEDRHSGCRLTVPQAHEGFRLYGALWTEQDVVFFVDREPVAVIEAKPGMDGPMYMMANLAVGGDWGGPPDATTPFPAAFEIDWIAAWRLADAPVR
jgi:beta-glucanase (GH16 family)